MANKQFTHWMAQACDMATEMDRQILRTLSSIASKGEACPPYISRHLKNSGIVITNDHIQTIN